MRILVSGSTGLLGAPLTDFLRSCGHAVVRLVRHGLAPDAIYWDPATGELNPTDFENFDAVIHLAGENISRRWSAKNKAEFITSRCRNTALLAQTLSQAKKIPKVFICASAVGFYGSCGSLPLTEESPCGQGFLAQLCQKWEQASSVLETRGVRIVHTRFGAILSPAGGMLAKLIMPFRLGLGAKLGSGAQFLSWVALDDAIGAINHALTHAEIRGPLNVVAPEPVTQAQFSAILAQQLHRPCFLRLPAWFLRCVFGEMADEMLLASQRALPQKLLASGYSFRFAHLQDALRHLMRL